MEMNMSLRAQRGNPGVWNQPTGDCFVTAGYPSGTLFRAMTTHQSILLL